jgi:hypothetical protein
MSFYSLLYSPIKELIEKWHSGTRRQTCVIVYYTMHSLLYSYTRELIKILRTGVREGTLVPFYCYIPKELTKCLEQWHEKAHLL